MSTRREFLTRSASVGAIAAAGDFAFLNIEGGIWEIADVSEMIEMGMRDKDRVDVFRRQTDLGKDHFWRTPILDK